MFGIMVVELLGSDSVFGFTDTALITEKRLFSCLDMCILVSHHLAFDNQTSSAGIH